MTDEERRLVHAIEQLCRDYRALPDERGGDAFHSHAAAMQSTILARAGWRQVYSDTDAPKATSSAAQGLRFGAMGELLGPIPPVNR